MVPYVMESDDGKTRQYLVGWSLNNGQQERIQLQENGIFNTPQITVSDVNNIQFITTTQHRVDIVSDYGTFEGQGWYDSSNTATILISPPREYLISYTIEGIEGQNAKLDGNTIQVLVDKPKTILIILNIHLVPLLAFLPGLLQHKPRVHIWLCFFVLLYFCEGVISAFRLPHIVGVLGLLEALLTAGLFVTAMLAARHLTRLQNH